MDLQTISPNRTALIGRITCTDDYVVFDELFKETEHGSPVVSKLLLTVDMKYNKISHLGILNGDHVHSK